MLPRAPFDPSASVSVLGPPIANLPEWQMIRLAGDSAEKSEIRIYSPIGYNAMGISGQCDATFDHAQLVVENSLRN